MIFKGTVYRRSSSDPPSQPEVAGEREVFKCNPQRVCRIIKETGWESVFCGTLNLRDCHRTSDSIYRYLRQDLVVPFSMEGIAFNVECGDLFIGDLEAGRVEV